MADIHIPRYDEFLVGHWKLDTDEPEEFLDSSSGGNNGTGTDITWVTSRRGEVPKFNGSSSKIVCGDPDDFNISGDATISIWINPSSVNKDIINKWTSSQAAWAVYSDSNSKFGILLSDNGTTYDTYTTDSDSIVLNTWQLLTITIDSSNVIFYKDGSEIKSLSNTTTSIFESNEPMAIAKSFIKGYFNGNIDDVRIYSTALTADEVSELYTSTQKFVHADECLVSHYKFDTVDDYSDSGHANVTGTPTNVDFISTRRGKKPYFDNTALVTVPNNDQFEMTEVTASVWFKTTSATDDALIERITSAWNSGWALWINDGKVESRIGRGGDWSPNTVTSSSTYNDGDWHLATAVLTNDEMELFVDGTSVGSDDTLSNPTLNGATDLLIGKNLVDNIKLTGYLDDARVYNVALTQDEITELYNNTQKNLSADNFLVSQWKLDGDYLDNVGSNDGTNNGSTMVDSRRGTSAYFDGTDDYVSVTHDDSFVTRSGTISTWFKASSIPPSTDTYYIVSKDPTGSENALGIILEDSNTIRFKTKDNSANWIDSQDFEFVDGEWHHIVGTFDDTTMSLYIDGVKDSGTAISDHLSNTEVFELGARSRSSLFFNGNISDFRFYDIALTPTEVSELYSSTQKFLPAENFLKGHWKFDGDFTDSSPSGNNGTATDVDLIDTRRGTAAYFNGSTSKIQVDGASYRYTDDFSISTWVKPNDTSDNNTLVSHSWVQNWGCSINNGNPRFYITDTNDTEQSILDTGTTIDTSEWTYLSFTYNAKTIRMYANGILVEEHTFTNPMRNTAWNTGLWFGQMGAHFYNGLMSDIMIHNTTLTSEEVLELYQSTTKTRPASDFLVGHWKLDGTNLDSSGNDNHGLMLNTMTDVDYRGKSTLFNGSDSVIHVSDVSDYLKNKPFTFGAWFKTSEVSDAIFETGDYTTGERRLIYTSPTGKFGIDIQDTWVFTNDTYNDGEWHYGIVSYDGYTTKLYIDGSFDNSDILTFVDYDSTTSTIGATQVLSNYFEGNLQNTRLYNIDLTPEEIQSIYSSEYVDFVETELEGTLEDSLVGHWKLDGNFEDSSVFENHGTPDNLSWTHTERGYKPLTTANNYEINCNTSDAYDINGEITISFWAYVDSITSGGYDKAISYFTSNTNGWTSTINSNGSASCSIGFGSDGGNPSATTSLSYELSKWNMFTFTIDTVGDISKSYLNGEFISSKTSLPTYYSFTGSELALMANEGNMVGKYDDFRMYNKALSADEIKDLYDSTKFNIGVPAIERTYNHKPPMNIDDTVVFATDMRTFNADGTLVDLSGNSNHGTVYGAVDARDGLEFKKADENRVDFGDSSVYEFTSGNAFTIEAFVKPTSSTTNHAAILGKETEYLIYNIDDEWSLWTWTGTSWVQLSIGSVDLNEYQHIVSTIGSDGTRVVYKNGIQMNSDITTLYSSATSNALIVGDKTSTGGNSFDGTINYVKIYNTALTASEVAKKYQEATQDPVYSLDISKIPDNTTVYSNAIPFTTGVINSGTFKKDSGVLECVTDGSITFSSGRVFDGEENVIYEGDATVTLVNGSSDILIEMLAGDTLDNLKITQR